MVVNATRSRIIAADSIVQVQVGWGGMTGPFLPSSRPNPSCPGQEADQLLIAHLA